MDIALLGQIPALLVLVVAAASVRWLSPWTHSWVIETLLLLAVSLMLPWIAGLVLIVGLLLARQGFAAANRLKIAMNGMPITWNDIAITRHHPSVLFHVFALNPRRWWLVLAAAAAGALVGLAYWLYGLTVVATWPAAIGAAVNIAVAAWVFADYRQRLVAAVSERIHTEDYLFGKDVKGADGAPIELFDPQAIAQLSYHLGPVGFLIYTQRLNRRFAMPIAESGAKQPADNNIASVELESVYVKRVLGADRGEPLPNIVLVQVESAINPNWAFELARPVNSALFDHGADTRLLVRTRANIIGGGSWVSEFEALTGLDVRLFGYLGYYAHTSIGRYVAGAFPDYLRKRGYRTHAFYSTGGAFYRTRQAFTQYGFDQFSDCHDLGISDWTASDAEFVAASRAMMWQEAERPLFAFLVTNGTHSPYAPVPQERFRTWFTSTAPQLAARLNGYLERLADAEAAVMSLRRTLAEQHERTGRPYVMMIYGDHQPSMFVSNPKLDFAPHRTAAPLTETFAHVLSNCRSPELAVNDAVPIAMLPTLLSGFVSEGVPYAPFNYLLHQKFGANFFPNYSFGGALGVLGGIDRLEPVRAEAQLDGQALDIQAAALRMMRQSGILRPELLGRA